MRRADTFLPSMILREQIRVGLSIILLLVFLWTCSNSIERLQMKEMARTTTILKDDQSDWPSVTICLYRSTMPNSSFADQVRSFPLIKDIISVSYMKAGGYEVANSTGMIRTRHWISLRKYYGVIKIAYQCFTTDIDIQRVVRAKIAVALSTPLFLNTGAQFIIQDQGFINPFSDVVPGMAVLSFQNEIPVSRVVQYTKSVIVEKNLGNRPCDEDNKQDVTACLYRYMESAVGCQLQWYKEDDSDKDNAANCSSEEDYERINAFIHKHEEADIDELMQASGCKRNCLYGKYGLEVNYEQPYAAGFNVTSFVLSSMERDTRVEREVFVYILSDCMADFGGYIGLLLGASALSVYDQLAKLYEQIRRHISRRRSGKISSGIHNIKGDEVVIKAAEEKGYNHDN